MSIQYMSEGTIQPQLWYLVEKFFTAICAKFKKNQSISSISSLVVVAYAGACQGCGGSSVPAGSGGSMHPQGRQGNFSNKLTDFD